MARPKTQAELNEEFRRQTERRRAAQNPPLVLTAKTVTPVVGKGKPQTTITSVEPRDVTYELYPNRTRAQRDAIRARMKAAEEKAARGYATYIGKDTTYSAKPKPLGIIDRARLVASSPGSRERAILGTPGDVPRDPISAITNAARRGASQTFIPGIMPPEEKIMYRQQVEELNPATPAGQSLREKPTIGKALTSPLADVQMITEVLTSFAPAELAAFLGGPVGGRVAIPIYLGLQSGEQEYLGSISGMAQQIMEQNPGMSQRQALQTVVSNPAVMKDAERRGITRGIIMATTMALGGKLGEKVAGRILPKAVAAGAATAPAVRNVAARQLGATAASTGITAGSFMAGEAATQLATEGKISRPEAIPETGLGLFPILLPGLLKGTVGAARTYRGAGAYPAVPPVEAAIPPRLGKAPAEAIAPRVEAPVPLMNPPRAIPPTPRPTEVAKPPVAKPAKLAPAKAKAREVMPAVKMPPVKTPSYMKIEPKESTDLNDALKIISDYDSSLMERIKEIRIWDNTYSTINHDGTLFLNVNELPYGKTRLARVLYHELVHLDQVQPGVERNLPENERVAHTREKEFAEAIGLEKQWFDVPEDIKLSKAVEQARLRQVAKPPVAKSATPAPAKKAAGAVPRPGETLNQYIDRRVAEIEKANGEPLDQVDIDNVAYGARIEYREAQKGVQVDTQNVKGLRGEVAQRQEPVKAEPVKKGGGKAAPGGRVVQEEGEVGGKAPTPVTIDASYRGDVAYIDPLTGKELIGRVENDSRNIGNKADVYIDTGKPNKSGQGTVSIPVKRENVRPAPTNIETVRPTQENINQIEKSRARTNTKGLTPQQVDYARSAIIQAKGIITDNPNTAVKIPIPKDGTFTVNTQGQAENLYKGITGKPMPEGAALPPPRTSPQLAKEAKKRVEGIPTPKAEVRPFGIESRLSEEGKAALAELRARKARGAAGKLPKGEGASEQLARDLKNVTIVGRDLIKAGIKDVETWSKAIIDEVGDWVKDHLPGIWREIGEETGEKSATAERMPELTAAKNASADEAKAVRGLPPRYAPLRQTHGETVDAAAARVEREPGIKARLVKELSEKTRAVSAEEEAILLMAEVDARNSWNSAVDAMAKAKESNDAAGIDAAQRALIDYGEELGKVELIMDRAGTESARAQEFRKAMMKEDFSLPSLIRQEIADSRGKQPSAERIAELQKVADEYQAKLDHVERTHQNLAAENERLKREVAAARKEGMPKRERTTGVRNPRSKEWGATNTVVTRADYESLLQEWRDMVPMGAVGRLPKGKGAAEQSTRRMAIASKVVAFHIEAGARMSYGFVRSQLRRDLPGITEREMRTVYDQATHEKASADYIKRTRTLIKKYQGRVSEGDLDQVLNRQLELSDEAMQAKMELEKTKQEWYDARFKRQMQEWDTLQKLGSVAMETIQLHRAYLTSVDLSGTYRQGGFLTVGDPTLLPSMIRAQLKALRSKEGTFRIEEEMRQSPYYNRALKAGLEFTEIAKGASLAKTQEAYRSRWAKKVPFVAQSERAYVTGLNRLMFTEFERIHKLFEAFGGKLTPKESENIAWLINLATGRTKVAERTVSGMTALFFAPKLAVSRFMLTVGAPLYRRGVSPRVRAYYAFKYASYLAGFTAMATMAAAAGAAVDTDPTSADFLKFRFGNIVLDMGSGFLQYVVLLSRVYNEIRNRDSVRNRGMRGENTYGERDTFDILTDFLRNKLSPIAGTTMDWLTGKGFAGQPVTAGYLAGRNLAPMGVQDIFETILGNVGTENPSLAAARKTVISLLGTLGGSVQNYPKKGNSGNLPPRYEPKLPEPALPPRAPF